MERPLFLRSRIAGIDYIAKEIKEDTSSNDDKAYIGGYKRFLTAAVERLLCVAAFGTLPVEKGLKMLMHDDRLLLICGSLRETMETSRQEVCGVPDHVWETIQKFATRGPSLASMHGSCAAAHSNAWALRCPMSNTMVSGLWGCGRCRSRRGTSVRI